jgi:hypothetical protein
MSVIMTPEELAARKRRSLWIALAISGFMALVFAVTLAQISASMVQS